MTDKREDLRRLLGYDPAQMQQLLRPLMPALDAAWRIPKVELPEIKAWTAELTQIQKSWAASMASLSQVMEPFREFLETLAREEKKYGRLDRAGWLPHDTTPFNLLPEEALDGEVGMILADYYRSAWPDVKAAFLRKLDNHSVDCEAKDNFREALNAHENGHYRCVPRLLFPEIERVVRDEFFRGDLRKRLTSQADLREAAANLPATYVTSSAVAGLRLYEKLVDHLYTHVQTEEALTAIANDPVPNRHAALHGLIVYKTEQSSLNALIMTEFVYGLVTLLKQDRWAAAA